MGNGLSFCGPYRLRQSVFIVVFASYSLNTSPEFVHSNIEAVLKLTIGEAITTGTQPMRRCIRDVHADLRSVLPPVQLEQRLPGVCNGLGCVPTPRSGGGLQPSLHLLHGRCEVMDPCDEAGVLGRVVTVLNKGQVDVGLLLRHNFFYDSADVLKLEGVIVATSSERLTHWAQTKRRPFSRPHFRTFLNENVRNLHTCAHFCCKMVHCGIFVWCIVGFVRCVSWYHIYIRVPLWRHEMEALSALLALCVENPTVTVGFTSQRHSEIVRCFCVSWTSSSTTVNLQVIWRTVTPMWCHCNAFYLTQIAMNMLLSINIAIRTIECKIPCAIGLIPVIYMRKS